MPPEVAPGPAWWGASPQKELLKAMPNRKPRICMAWANFPNTSAQQGIQQQGGMVRICLCFSSGPQEKECIV